MKCLVTDCLRKKTEIIYDSTQYKHTHTYICGVMVITEGNGHDDTISNPGLG